MRTIRSECLDEFVIFGERHLRYVVQEFVEHYQAERHHQGLRIPAICAARDFNSMTKNARVDEIDD